MPKKKSLYEVGQLVWYIDEWSEVCSIGIVLGVQAVTKYSVEYDILDLNNKTFLDEDGSYMPISVLNRSIAPICYYKNIEEFRKSRGYKWLKILNMSLKGSK